MLLLDDRPHLRLPLGLVILMVMLLVLWQAGALTRDAELERLEQGMDTLLARYRLSLRKELEKYRHLPALLATQARLAEVLDKPNDEAAHQVLSRYLQRVARMTEASDVYLMAPDGTTLAASNWQQEASFVGRNFGYRPYFQEAMAGRPGRYFALGSTSRRRGYYFSNPVSAQGRVLGVVVVKIDLNDIEQQWNDPLTELVVTDPDNVIFISTRPAWKFRSLEPLSEASLARIRESMRYGDQPLKSLPVVDRQPRGAGARLLTLLEDQAAEGGGTDLAAREYLVMSRPLAGTGLSIVALTRTAAVTQQVWKTVLVTAVVFVVLVLGALFALLRRRILLERQRFKLQATRTLEANEARVRAIIDNTQAGLITLDAQGRIESVNPTAAAQFAYPPGALEGAFFSKLLGPADQPLCRRLITEPLAAGRGVDAPLIEAQGCRHDNRLFPIELTIVAMAPGGERRFLATVHDISVRKGYEAHLKEARDQLENRVAERTQDLERANQRLREEIEEHRHTQEALIQTAKMAVLGQLSAGINHELNQPLTAIRAYADNASAFLERGRQQPVVDNLREISALAEHMAKIIAPLKVFSRKTSGQLEPVSLASVREGAMSILYGRLQTDRVDLVWPPGLEDVLVMGDMVRLEQVLVNLIGNAIQAMQASPERRVEISCEQTPHWVELCVGDRGPGIPEADLQRVFEPFYTTKKAGEGLGLGLSISHRILESLGGQLTAANRPGGGALFRLRLQPVPAAAFRASH